VHACAGEEQREHAATPPPCTPPPAKTPDPLSYYPNSIRKASPAVVTAVKETGLSAYLDSVSERVLQAGMLPAMERVATWAKEWEEGGEKQNEGVQQVPPTLQLRVHRMLTGLASLIARGSKQHLLRDQQEGAQLNLGGCPVRKKVLAGGMTVQTDDSLCMPYDLAAVRAAKWAAIHTHGYLKIKLGKDEDGQVVWEMAHRLLRWATFGPPKAGEEGSHCCPSRPQPRCLNVLHLRWETHAENVARQKSMRAAARKRDAVIV